MEEKEMKMFYFFLFIHGSPESSDFNVGLLLTPHLGTRRLLEKKILKKKIRN